MVCHAYAFRTAEDSNGKYDRFKYLRPGLLVMSLPVFKKQHIVSQLRQKCVVECVSGGVASGTTASLPPLPMLHAAL